ncbi:MAG: hypothetical protein AAFW75_26590, partial [Cyanobacteria bacterium J06636_16]
MIVLFMSEVFSVLGLTGIGVILIVSSGRAQLLNQAISELTVNDINYNIKVNQMGFGFREQSDNAAVLAAATRYHDEREIDPELVRQVRQILQNEVRARDIEYATLVGPDRRILVSAYKNRQGEVFDPKGLVSYVLEHPEQIKTSELLSWEDLSHENLPRSAAIQPQSDVLIRYTVTPVIANDGVVAGVLVSG